MKLYSGAGIFFALLWVCMFAACQAPLAKPPTQSATRVAQVSTPGNTPTLVVPDTLTPTATTTVVPTPTRTARPTAVPTPTPMPLSGRIAFGSIREDSNKDGRITYEDNSRIVELNLATGEQIDITDGTHDVFDPAWSPDGRQIAFISNQNGNYELYVMNRDGSGIRQLTTTDGAEGSPSWSPDGSQIVYEFSPWTEYGFLVESDLYVTSPATGMIWRLTETPGDEQGPDWSPDGRFILFSRDPEGDIYWLDVATKQERLLSGELPRDPHGKFMLPQWLPRQSLAFSVVRLGLMSSDLGAEPLFDLFVYEVDWQNGQPTLVVIGHDGTSVGEFDAIWGPNGEWLLNLEYPGLIATRFIRQRLPNALLTPPIGRGWGESTEFDLDSYYSHSPDWTP